MAVSALVLSATPPLPIDNGKRAVMHGFLDYLVERLGAENVHFALVDQPDADYGQFAGTAHRLQRPGSVAQLLTLRRCVTDRSYTIQEAMLGTRSVTRQIHRLLDAVRPGIELYDTIRLAQHAPVDRRPSRRILYLDDLFSIRYRRIVDTGRRGGLDINPLGGFADNVPAVIHSLARQPMVYRPLFRFEGGRISRREVDVLRSFDASLLVSSAEVAELRRRSGSANIAAVSPLLPPVAARTRRPATPPQLVFLGKLDIPHNDDAICTFLQVAMDELVRRIPDVMLRIAGRKPSGRLRHLAARFPRNVGLAGFVENLDDLFARATVTIAPLRFGSGVKIKVLESLARGVPVLATSIAAEGIPGVESGGCLVEDDVVRWPGLIADLISDGGASMSAAAAEFFARNYGRQVVLDQYDGIFGLSGRRPQPEALRGAG